MGFNKQDLLCSLDIEVTRNQCWRVAGNGLGLFWMHTIVVKSVDQIPWFEMVCIIIKLLTFLCYRKLGSRMSQFTYDPVNERFNQTFMVVLLTCMFFLNPTVHSLFERKEWVKVSLIPHMVYTFTCTVCVEIHFMYMSPIHGDFWDQGLFCKHLTSRGCWHKTVW